MTATADQGALALDDTGAGEPLVLVHGLATTRLIWRRVVPRLERAHRVVALDLPGFGGSPPAAPHLCGVWCWCRRPGCGSSTGGRPGRSARPASR